MEYTKVYVVHHRFSDEGSDPMIEILCVTGNYNTAIDRIRTHCKSEFQNMGKDEIKEILEEDDQWEIHGLTKRSKWSDFEKVIFSDNSNTFTSLNRIYEIAEAQLQ
jgi:hypothetical protein